MQETELHIKNMVCDRCIRVVREELEALGYNVKEIELGEVRLVSELLPDMEQIKAVLAANGFELLEDRRVQLVNQVKTLIISLVREGKLEGLHENISDYLARETGKDYHYLSQLFSSQEPTTIEKYIILQKVEMIKELLVYGELTVSEIAYQLGYSSVAHLSNQFKQVTGFTPSAFRQTKTHDRKPLDKI